MSLLVASLDYEHQVHGQLCVKLSLNVVVHPCSEVTASLHFLAMSYCCADYSDANFCSIELD
jgi:hypothetical protein